MPLRVRGLDQVQLHADLTILAKLSCALARARAAPLAAVDHPAVESKLVLALRIGFTVVVMAVVIWLLSTGNPVGGLLIVPALAVWVRRAAESGRLTRFAGRLARSS
jgi:Flp pilus assembly protein TadB